MVGTVEPTLSPTPRSAAPAGTGAAHPGDALDAQALVLALPGPQPPVSALLSAPPAARACYVLAHGAGAGMQHPFLRDMAAALAARGVACLRFNFPFAEKGSKRVDSPATAQATVRAAVALAAQRLPGLPLFAGGKSFGGRMASQAHAAAALAGVRGLVFLGFPLHPAGQPGVARADHLAQTPGPLLFVQGTADALAGFSLIKGVVADLGPRATLHALDGADHGFHVPARSGRSDAQVLASAADAAAAWMADHGGGA